MGTVDFFSVRLRSGRGTSLLQESNEILLRYTCMYTVLSVCEVTDCMSHSLDNTCFFQIERFSSTISD